MQKFATLPSVVGLAIASAGFMGSITSANAQSFPVCQPPGAGEYLLLVVSPTAENRTQLRNALPNEIKTTSCQYLNDTVTRIGGFRSIDDANRWARYINTIVGLSAIITTRPGEAPTQQASAPRVTYNPQALGQGYAVLVDYFNRPELVNSVQQAVGGNVGLASYGQRPFLLAVYTTNQQEAYNTLQRLNERGFFAVLVDSRNVILLRSVVR
ncbi:unknown protein [Nostoc sp. NIES-3756]|uniref:hypothetical protein n=1 Tax=Nostoc sp. NIES-3756 TaxID=1751286 RepID=UPI00071FCD33|nr:hypothetical protein [Nostoc sp. NIES-3756]BAT55053.1 unknown protein [Nostoc sp. NIES-3756]BAY37164.1 hypothetical protein NIES2111_14990 [Nostoc sp. NIES-2111]